MDPVLPRYASSLARAPPCQARCGSGERAWGGISTGEIISRDPRSQLALGPYAAACLASAHVFNTVRVVVGRTSPPESVFYSLWSFETSHAPPTDPAGTGPHDVSVALDAVLAGSGAVGCAWLHAIWAAPSLTGRVVVADDDKEGVDLSNLNRCIIFARIARQAKGERGEAHLPRRHVDIQPYDGPVGAVEDRPPLLLSAVDTNRSREAVQGLYPAHLLSASTHGMRAELLRCDPPAGAACLRCFNPPETGTPDEVLRRRFLAASPERQAELADAAGQTLAAAVRWAIEGTCGYATDRLMEHMRTDEAGALCVRRRLRVGDRRRYARRADAQGAPQRGAGRRRRLACCDAVLRSLRANERSDGLQARQVMPDVRKCRPGHANLDRPAHAISAPGPKLNRASAWASCQCRVRTLVSRPFPPTAEAGSTL